MFVAYFRVSTAKQGISGLGLEAQQAAVERFVGPKPMLATFTEIETGRKADRPQLRAAIAECRKHGATLLIAKLDRLARNVAFVSGLMDSGCDFIACDMPDANRLTVHIMAAMAEHEARCISDRTKAALAAKKARGEVWGPSSEIRQAALTAGVATNKAKASSTKARVQGRCRSLRDAGRSLNEIAAVLNQAGERTSRGLQFTPTAVYRILDGATGGHAGRF